MIPMTTWSKYSFAAARFWDCGFESRRGHGCLLLSVVRCQVVVSASG